MSRRGGRSAEVNVQQAFSSYESQRSTFGNSRANNSAGGPPGRGPPSGRSSPSVRDSPGGSGSSDGGSDDGRGDVAISGGTVDPDDLIEFLTSRWLKLTVVAQPDLHGLLTHPVLRNVIAAIARDALTEVMNQMREAMESQVYKQMDRHLRPLAKKSAAYSLSELTAMSPGQITDYNTFAPSISAPPIRGGDDADDEEEAEPEP